jgi:hypothetical protein
MLSLTDDGNSADVSKTKDGSDLAPEPLVGGLEIVADVPGLRQGTRLLPLAAGLYALPAGLAASAAGLLVLATVATASPIWVAEVGPGLLGGAYSSGLDLAMIAGAVLVAIAAIAVYLTLPASASRKIASPLMSNSPVGTKPSRW